MNNRDRIDQDKSDCRGVRERAHGRPARRFPKEQEERGEERWGQVEPEPSRHAIRRTVEHEDGIGSHERNGARGADADRREVGEERGEGRAGCCSRHGIEHEEQEGERGV
ncbi:MAG TPA: hypothetical protein VHJ19_02655, partial [Gammaproteobacteria bacterium]|nr:hypothetical protein [Gammaproteobacteria bacterium]